MQELLYYLIFVAGIESETTFEYDILHAGFVRIAPGDYLAFKTAGEDGKVYVSVKYESELVADNFQMDNNYSIIVKKGGYLRKTKMGEIWVDQQGVHYENA